MTDVDNKLVITGRQGEPIGLINFTTKTVLVAAGVNQQLFYSRVIEIMDDIKWIDEPIPTHARTTPTGIYLSNGFIWADEEVAEWANHWEYE